MPKIICDSKLKHVNDYVNMLAPHAINVWEETGINPAIPIIQSAIETGWGNKVLVVRKEPNASSDKIESHNYFNIKWSSGCGYSYGWAWVDEYDSKGNRYFLWDKFRVYNSVEDSIKDWVSFVSNKSYCKDAIKNKGDVVMFFRGLQEDLYNVGEKHKFATAPNYVSTATSLAKVIRFEEDKKDFMSNNSVNTNKEI